VRGRWKECTEELYKGEDNRVDCVKERAQNQDDIGLDVLTEEKMVAIGDTKNKDEGIDKIAIEMLKNVGEKQLGREWERKR